MMSTKPGQGQASIVTTQRYARLSDDAVRREVERLARVSGDNL
jgi:hypothetical protein